MVSEEFNIVSKIQFGYVTNPWLNRPTLVIIYIYSIYIYVIYIEYTIIYMYIYIFYIHIYS